jgi:hypothetical protein
LKKAFRWFVIFLFVMGVLGYFLDNSESIKANNVKKHLEKVNDIEENKITLPNHTINKTSLGQKGYRIQINVTEAYLSKELCENLSNYYKDQAKPNGQVTIYGPSIKMQKLFPDDPSAKNPQVWTYDNLDGTGIHYNNYNYGK